MDIDDVFVKTGEFGKFQKRAFFAMCLTTLFCGTQMVQNIFDGALPDEKDLICEHDRSLKACDPKCTNISSPKDPFVSYATEWNLYCGPQQSYISSTQSIYMLGVMCGSFFMGGLGDRYGRFPILFGCECLTTLFGFVSSFSPAWTVLAGLRFFTGFFLSGVIIVGFVLTSELVGPSKRNIVGTIPALTFAMGICLMSITAWITLNWRVMAGVCGLLGALTVPPVWWFFEESPRWYLGKGDLHNSKRILDKISRMNGHQLGSINLKVAENSSNGESGGTSMLDLFRNRILLKITVIQMYSWFTVSAVYYGLTLAAGDLGGNRYVSVVMNAFVEIPSNLIVIYIMNHPRCGRVRTCCMSLVIGSVCCAIVAFLPSNDNKFSNAVIALACGGKFFVCMAFAIVYVQAAELYPTPVRNVGLGFVSIFNRVGGVLSAQIVLLDSYWHNSHFAVFSALAAVCAGVCLILPETLGRPLPDTPQDLYTNGKKLDKDIVRLQSEPDRRKLLSDMDDEEEVNTIV